MDSLRQQSHLLSVLRMRILSSTKLRCSVLWQKWNSSEQLWGERQWCKGVRMSELSGTSRLTTVFSGARRRRKRPLWGFNKLVSDWKVLRSKVDDDAGQMRVVQGEQTG